MLQVAPLDAKPSAGSVVTRTLVIATQLVYLKSEHFKSKFLFYVDLSDQEENTSENGNRRWRGKLWSDLLVCRKSVDNMIQRQTSVLNVMFSFAEDRRRSHNIISDVWFETANADEIYLSFVKTNVIWFMFSDYGIMANIGSLYEER